MTAGSSIGIAFSLAGIAFSALSLVTIHLGRKRKMNTETASKEVALIRPAPVQRDENGDWIHPDLPTFYGTDEAKEGAPKWNEWMKAQGLEQRIRMLEDEDESHPVYQSYFEAQDPDPNFSKWEPQPPEGEGWFLLAITDTEDGPCAWFVRRKDSTNG